MTILSSYPTGAPAGQPQRSDHRADGYHRDLPVCHKGMPRPGGLPPDSSRLKKPAGGGGERGEEAEPSPADGPRGLLLLQQEEEGRGGGAGGDALLHFATESTPDGFLSRASSLSALSLDEPFIRRDPGSLLRTQQQQQQQQAREVDRMSRPDGPAPTPPLRLQEGMRQAPPTQSPQPPPQPPPPAPLQVGLSKLSHNSIIAMDS